MSGNLKIIKHGTTFSPHVLEDLETGEKVHLCACGGTHNAEGRCDGTHNKKKPSGCDCEFCVEKKEKDNP
jgi:CDGSH-type Zn-finger protein